MARRQPGRFRPSRAAHPAALVLISLLTFGAASRARATFDSLFGAEAKKVSSSSTTSDDARFAATLLEKAGSLGDDPGLALLLYEKAYEFGLKDAAGYATAAAAMKRLAEAAPDRAAEARQKLVKVYELRHRKAKGSERAAAAGELVGHLVAEADARAEDGEHVEAMTLYRRAATVAASGRPGLKEQVQARLKRAEARQQAQAKVDKLEQKLRARPDDAAAAAQLARLYLLELDDPAGAATHAPAAGDEDLGRWAPLAARTAGELDESQLLGLAEWYAGLAGGGGGGVSASARAVALGRARKYAEAFLEAHPEDDGDRLRAAKVRDEAREQLAAVQPAGRVDLLALVDASQDAVAGKWSRTKAGLQSDATPNARLELPYRPPAEYDLEVEFTRTGGNDAVCVVCAAGGRQFMWTMGGARNSVVGFQLVDGAPIHDRKNPTVVRAERLMSNGKRYRTLLKVRRGGVSAYVNGRAVAEWKTDYQNAGLHRTFELKNPDTLGLFTYESPTVFQSVSLVPVSGEGEPLR
jgi:hypothetical protein